MDDLSSDLWGGDELFRCFDTRLEVILKFLCPPGTNVSEKVAQISVEAKRRARTAIDIHPDLSNYQTNALLRKIDQKVVETEERSTNTTQEANDLGANIVIVVDDTLGVGIQEAYRDSDSDKLDKILGLLEKKSSAESRIPPAIFSQFESAKTLLNEGLLEKAMHQFEVLIGILESSKIGKESVHLKGRCEWNIGIALYQMRRKDESLNYFDSAYDLNPANIRIATLKAMSCHWQGDTDQALLILNDLLKNHTDDTSIIVTLADVEAEIYGPLKALERLENLELIQDETVSLTKAQHLTAANRIDEAIVCLRAALDIKRDSYRLKTALASSLLRQKHNNLALPIRVNSLKKESLNEARILLESAKEELIGKGAARGDPSDGPASLEIRLPNSLDDFPIERRVGIFERGF